ncbi:MAG: AbrB/MazE/SpoVT family DNA-binding domain-containing protein [Euryarchaeota archaeon]|nr:AbrB/MazE/SpoVT family DNA-binding domain-containing protein [Euryarchaeota archaeon]
MAEFIRELFANGKITIPREIRELYGIRDGDYVQVKILGVVRAAGVVPVTEPVVEKVQEITSVAMGIHDLTDATRRKDGPDATKEAKE